MSNKFFYFGKLSHNLWFIFFTAFFYSLRYILDFMNKKKIQSEFSIFHPFIDIFFMFLSEALSLPLYFYYTYKKNKLIEQKPITSQNNLYQKIIVAGLIIFVTLCDLLVNVFIKFINLLSDVLDHIVSGMFIFIIAGLCLLIFKYKYHRHHLLGIGITYFGLFIDYFIYDDSFKIDDIITILFAICRNSCMAIQDMYEKYIMDKKYVHPLLMLGSEGIIDSNNGNMFAYNRSYRMCN